MIRLVCLVEIADATTVEDALSALDAFREAVQPSFEYGLTIYHATEREADTGRYAPDVPAVPVQYLGT